MEISEHFRTFLHFTIGLLTILNPIAAAAIMVSLIPPEVTQKEITKSSLRTSMVVLIASLLTIFFGDLIFKLFGINIHSLKIIGGIVLMVLALSMIKGKISETQHSKEEQEEALEKEDISVIPLGIPILFGPGTMTTVIIFKELCKNYIDLSMLVLSVFVSTLVVFITLKNSVVIDRFLGVTGVKITTRLMGLIVGAIASQFIISGVKALWNMY